MEMKKGDLIIVYKVCVGSLYNEKDIKDILKKLENADNKDLRLKSDLIREFLNSIIKFNY